MNKTVSFLGMALLFILLWVTLALRVDPRLIYYGGGTLTQFPVFLKTQAFWQHCISQPGGLLQYAVAYMAQWMYHPWTGAAWMALHALALGWTIRSLLIPLKIPYRSLWLAIGIALIVIPYHQYTYHLATASGILAALLGFRLYQILQIRVSAWICFLILSPLLYILIGAPTLLFALLCILQDGLFLRQWRRALLLVAISSLIPTVIGGWLYSMSPLNAYTNGLSISWELSGFPDRHRALWTMHSLSLFMPGLMLFYGILGHLCPQHQQGHSSVTPLRFKRILWGDWPEGLLQKILGVVIPLLIVGGVQQWSQAPHRKVTFKAYYDQYYEHWDDLLNIPQKEQHSKYSNYVCHVMERALCHTNRSQEEMFHYPQHPSMLFFSGPSQINSHWRRVGLLWDLGLYNQCECSLVEAIELHGHRPMLLERLACLRMIKGDIHTARVCLQTLRCHPFWNETADYLLAQIQNDPNLTSHPFFKKRRSLMSQTDQVAISFNMEQQILNQLKANPNNRIAYNTLMTWYALTRQLSKFTDELHRLNDFGIHQIPPIYEQIILTYLYTQKLKSPIINSISAESKQGFNLFLKTLDPFGSNRAAAYPSMLQQFGDTYYFYYIFSRNQEKP